MTRTIAWSLVTAVVCGLLFGIAAGNTPIGIVTAIVFGLLAGALLHARRRAQRPGG